MFPKAETVLPTQSTSYTFINIRVGQKAKIKNFRIF